MASHDNPAYDEDKTTQNVRINSYVIKSKNESIQEFSLESTESEKEIHGSVESMTMSLSSSLLSGLYLMVVVSFSVVIKTNLLLSGDVTAVDVYWFVILLFTIGSLWMALYQPLATSCYKHKEKLSFARSNHVTNRWLKGVLALFGLAIIVKDGLEFIACLTIKSSLCEARALYAALPVCNVVFLVLQVNYLFRHSKVFTQEYQALSKFGVMHVIGTNLSVWIATVIDEAVREIGTVQNQNKPNPTSTSAVTTLLPSDVSSTLSANKSVWMPSGVLYSDASSHVDAETGLLFYGNCSCSSSYCSTVSLAESFLFPFVIEFSLVASCLLYITWKNIGKAPPVSQYIIKPSYKLHGSYKGAIAGSAALFATTLVIVILGTASSSDSASTGFQEINSLIIYDAFYILVEVVMIVSCCFGFYLYMKIRQDLKEESEQLDAVLLIICLVGPLVYGMFGIFGVFLSNDSQTSKFILSLLHPLVDILQSIIQIIFIMRGLSREPITSRTNDPNKKKSNVPSQPFSATDSNDEGIGLKETTDESEISSNNCKVEYEKETELGTISTSLDLSPKSRKENKNFDTKTFSSLPADLRDVSSEVDSNYKMDSVAIASQSQAAKFKNGKIVAEERVTPPDRKRKLLRDVLMFLLISNACLWIFLSLEGTAFDVETYQDQYYGGDVWTIISMICRPLNIFFRMHSAACLFEIWSFA